MCIFLAFLMTSAIYEVQLLSTFYSVYYSVHLSVCFNNMEAIKGVILQMLQFCLLTKINLNILAQNSPNTTLPQHLVLFVIFYILHVQGDLGFLCVLDFIMPGTVRFFKNTLVSCGICPSPPGLFYSNIINKRKKQTKYNQRH